jgi:Tfp pilus assembly protein PilN
MIRNRRKTAAPTVAIEVGLSRLHVAVREPPGGAGRSVIRTRTLQWRKQATALHGEVARRELAQALTTVSAEERLRGAAVNVALSCDFCVTRVAIGRTSQVRQELKELEQRASLYLGLGVGQKTVSAALSPLDARHEHGLMAVANERLLDGLLAALLQAGFRPAVVQPSLLALSRLLGRAGLDANSPKLIVNLAEGGLELGISYRGQLLLDYRPGGRGGDDEAAEIVAQHWSRIQRYGARAAQQLSAKGDATLVSGGFLFGSPEAVKAAQHGFHRWGKLDMSAFDATSIDPLWDFRSPPGPEHAAALGNCLDLVASSSALGPNFMDRVIARQRRGLAPLALCAGWPVAAVLLVTIGLGGFNFFEKSQCAELTRRIEELEPLRAKASRLQTESERAQTKMEHLAIIRHGIANPAWSEILANIAQCLPDSVWLNRLEVEDSRKLRLSGASYDGEAAFELVRWLDQAPGLDNVQLEGMQSQRLANGPATTFDVNLNLATFAGSAPRKEQP